MHVMRVLGGVLVLTSLFCLGCGDSGPERGYVEGTVTMDGEPLPDAVVTFQPEGPGRPSFGRTDENGHYELQYTSDKKGALVDTHRVTISTQERGRSPEGGYGADQEGGAKATPEKVPARYNWDSELTETVESGNNTIDFELSSEGEIKEEAY